MAQCLWPQHPPPSPLSPAGLARCSPCWGWHMSPASRDGGPHAAISSGGSYPPHPSPTQEAWPLQAWQAGRLPSQAPLHLHLHPLHLLQGYLLPGLGLPWVQPTQPPHLSEHGAAPSFLALLALLALLHACPQLSCPWPSYLPHRSAPSRPGIAVPAHSQPSPSCWASRAT